METPFSQNYKFSIRFFSTKYINSIFSAYKCSEGELLHITVCSLGSFINIRDLRLKTTPAEEKDLRKKRM